MKKDTLVVLFFCFSAYGLTQNCAPLQRHGGTIWDELLPDKISKVCISNSSESDISISVDYVGFKDKNYIIIGKILDAQKIPIEEIGKIIENLSYVGNSVELEFTVTKTKPNYTNPLINSGYLEVTIAESEELVLWGVKAMYKLERSWEVPGVDQDNSNIVVPVKLIPYKTTTENPTKN